MVTFTRSRKLLPLHTTFTTETSACSPSDTTTTHRRNFDRTNHYMDGKSPHIFTTRVYNLTHQDLTLNIQSTKTMRRYILSYIHSTGTAYTTSNQQRNTTISSQEHTYHIQASTIRLQAQSRHIDNQLPIHSKGLTYTYTQQFTEHQGT